MSSSHDEARSLTRGAFVLLLISLVRYGGDVVTRFTAADPSAPDTVLDSLHGRTRAAIDEEARRGRPLQGGETIDPNAADAIELDRLPGVGPATASEIVAARDAGLVFRRPDDLLAVRGIGPASVERLRGHLAFDGARSSVRRGGARPDRRPPERARRPGSRPPRSAAPVDLNSADAAALEGLPGVGPALAARIIEERRERPFEDIEDLVRVRGIGTATVERLRGLAVVRGIH